MGKGGRADVDRDQEFTWDEVKDHSKSDDGWIVIGNEVYDISTWARKHPGGSRILGHYAGQDASVSVVLLNMVKHKCFKIPQNVCQNFTKIATLSVEH